MHPNPTTPFPVLPYLPSTLVTPPKENKIENKNFIYLAVEAVVYDGGARGTPFCPNSFPCKCSLQRAIGLVGGLSLLLHHQY